MGRAVVIGAGIGGLTAGLALAADGWQVEVIERAPALRPVGIALLIAPNAQRALAALPGNVEAAVPARPPRPGQDEVAELVARFGRLPAPIPQLLARIDPATMLRSDIHVLGEPLPAYHRGRVAILGDAAHAMTPNLGQDACQAIEDAVTLAHHVGAAGVAAGLPAYTAARLPRTVQIARRSARIARLATLRNPVLQAVRNTALRAAGRFGPSVVQRQADFVLDWQPPVLERSG